MNIEKWTLEDGRKAEKRVLEQKNDDGHVQRVIELHVEEERPLRLQQRVIEKTKPFIYERKIEVVDPKTGNVVEEKVETLAPEANVNVSAQSFEEEECDCNITKQEIIDTVIAAIKATKDIPSQPSNYVPSEINFSEKLKSLGIADEIGKNKSSGSTDPWFIGAAVLAIAVLGYVLFFM